MAVIVILGVRFNLDKKADKEIHDALYALPEGQRVRTVKEALRSYLLEVERSSYAAGLKPEPRAPNQKRPELEKIQPASKTEPLIQRPIVTADPIKPQDDALGEQETKSTEIINSLKSMIQ